MGVVSTLAGVLLLGKVTGAIERVGRTRCVTRHLGKLCMLLILTFAVDRAPTLARRVIEGTGTRVLWQVLCVG